MKKIFISYSHKDERWKEVLKRHSKFKTKANLPLKIICTPEELLED